MLNLNKSNSSTKLIDQPSSPDVGSTLLDVDSSIPKPAYSSKIYYTMLVAGFSNLLGWNAFITAFPFFDVLLVGSSFETSYGNFFSFVFTFGGLLALTYSLATQKRSNWERRIIIGFTINAIVFVLFALLPYATFIKRNSAFYVVLLLDLILTFSAGYAQSPLFAYASLLSPVYMQAMMTGQAVAGIFSSVFQLAVAYLTNINSSDSSDDKIMTGGLKLRTLICFSVSGLLVVYSIVLLIALKKSPSYIKEVEYFDYQAQQLQNTMTEEEEEAQRPKNWREHLKLITATFMEIFSYNHAVFMTYVVTLAVFPTLTSKVRADNPKYNIRFLIEWHFVIFNIGDFIGRPLASFVGTFSNWTHAITFGIYKLSTSILRINRSIVDGFNKNRVYVLFMLLFSYVRWVFLPIFLANSTCSSSSPSTAQMILGSSSSPNTTSLLSARTFLRRATGSSDGSLSNIFFLLAVLILGITNGFIASCTIVVGPKISKNPGLAAGIMSFSVLLGLAVGSLLSFPVSSSC